MKTTAMLSTVVVSLLLAAPAAASPGAARKLERRAFAHLERDQFCEAASAFVRADRAHPDKRHMWNAALAAEMARDYPLALELLGRADSAPGVAPADQRAAAERIGAREDQTAAWCPRPLPDDADEAQLRAYVTELERRLDEVYGKTAKTGDPKDQTKPYTIKVDGSPTRGSRWANTDIVVFTDFQCPFCSRVHQPLLDALDDPRLKGKVRVVYKHFPLSFHKQARGAAHAAMAAREQGEKYFWAMANKLYENQRSLNSESYSRWAEEIGLDVRRFERDLKKNKARYEEIIERDMAYGQKHLKVRGTPSIFIGGWYENQARDADKIVEALGKHRQGAVTTSFVRVLTKG